MSGAQGAGANPPAPWGCLNCFANGAWSGWTKAGFLLALFGLEESLWIN